MKSVTGNLPHSDNHLPIPGFHPAGFSDNFALKTHISTR